MDISNIVSTDYEEYAPEDTVSNLVGTFADPSVKGVVVRGDEFEGIVTRRQFITSHHQPNEKLKSLVWHVPRLSPDEDVRQVAQLMIDSDSRVLPVFEGRDLIGVVTEDDVLQEVKPFLDAATVEDAYTEDLVTVGPDDKFAEAIHLLREYGFTHLPVVEDSTAVGILSLYDVTGYTIRDAQRSQGGDPSGGVDAQGGEISHSQARARRGGYGSREGERKRILDMPVRDVMVSPVETIHTYETLERAAEKMDEIDGSSLVVVRDGVPDGIVTKTDLLESLTWQPDENRSVQIYGIELLDSVSYDDVAEMVDEFDRRDQGMDILGAKVHLHEHKERTRGTPLIHVRVRLHTTRGLYVASEEGYGASHALNEVRDTLERQIRDRKTRGQNKKHPDEEFWEKRFGWMLEE